MIVLQWENATVENHETVAASVDNGSSTAGPLTNKIGPPWDFPDVQKKIWFVI